MKVRVFVPDASAVAGEPSFRGKDHHFPLLPSAGHVLHFQDGSGDFTVRTVGFVQVEDAFLPAVWLETTKTAAVINANEPGVQELPQAYRDLNHDVPPDIMTDY